MTINENTDSRIAAEIDRISKYFDRVSESQRAIALPLIENAAFMRIVLEDLQEIIKNEGVTESYQNGANQFGIKQSASLQSYNSLIKNYAAVIKTLDKMLPYMPPQKIGTIVPELKPVQRKTQEEINAEINRAAEWQRQQREKERMSKSTL